MNMLDNFRTSSWAVFIKISVGILLVAVSNLSVSNASVIQFDPTGSGGGTNVTTFDFLPGNSVFKGIGNTMTVKEDQNTTVYVQTRLGKVYREDGSELSIPGLNAIPDGINSSFEYTVVLGYDASADISLISASKYGTVYSLLANPGVKFFKIFYDDYKTHPGTQAKDWAGTGFDDGIEILSGTITAAEGAFSSRSTPVPLPAFDSFASAHSDFPGINSLRIAGGSTLSIDVDSYDTNFFPSTSTTLNIQLYNQSDIAPFISVDPSLKFMPNLVNYVPSIGSTNGLGNDLQVQSDPNSSFMTSNNVPEPSSFVLAGVGLLGVLRVVARRRAAN